MREIDERVVEMRFDNKQFESGVKQTLSTLDKLKMALNLPNSSKAMENLDRAARNVNLDGIASGVAALEKRFSTMGIVGMRVIENLTDSFMNFASKGVNFVTDSIVSGGIKRAMNIENAHFSLQALLKDEAKVQAIMDNAMESVDGTAYAYDEAAKAAASFAASGVKAGDEMLGALKSIAGTAAMTNSDYQSMSMIFTTVAGQGRLMGDQLLQLSSRGMNAAATLADYLREVEGQANITEAEVRDMVSGGEISFNRFAAAMQWAFGESAERANETFTGSLSNVKSALARIGAGFISPLVEQNGELIQLFNALRLKINDVKGALVFDEQKSAISGLTKESNLMVETVSKMAMSGTIGFDRFTDAILKTSKSEEELARTNEKLSGLFDQVKEKGFVTTEMLNEFSDSGLKNLDMVSKYMNGVLTGSIKVSDSLKKSIQDITGGSLVFKHDVERFAKEGTLSYEIFSNAVVSASGVIGRETGVIEDTFKGLFAEVKKTGSASYEVLRELEQGGIKSFSSLKDYMNGVLDGSIRASYATKSAIEEISGGMEVTTHTVASLAREGKISFDIFQSAMENAFGDSKALSKQFTDSFLDTIHNVVEAVQNFDLTKPMEAFYYGVEAAKNAAKGLWSVIGPFGEAFADVFLSFSGDDLVSFAAALERVTAKMRLSEKSSQNLHDTFEGLFSVVDLLATIFIKLLQCILPISDPMASMGDGMLSVTGAVGRTLTAFTKFVKSSTTVSKGYNLIRTSIQGVMSVIGKFIRALTEAGEAVANMPIVQKAIDALTEGFKKFGRMGVEYIKPFIKDIDEFGDHLLKMIPADAEQLFQSFSGTVESFFKWFEGLSLKKLSKDIKDSSMTFEEAIKRIANGNKALEEFLLNAVNYGKELGNAFSFENITAKLKDFRASVDSIVNWIKEKVTPAFSDLTFGGLVSGGAGVGIIVSLLKLTTTFEKMSKSLPGIAESLKGAFGSVKGVLVAYQKDLKASMILKIAGAIALLSGALLLLSFADLDQVVKAAGLLAVIGGLLIAGIDVLAKALNYGNGTLYGALTAFAKKIGSSFKKLGRAFEIKALGQMAKDIGISIGLIAGSILLMAKSYGNDKESFMVAVDVAKNIGLALVAVLSVCALIANHFDDKKLKNFDKVANSVVKIAASLMLVVLAIDKLVKMDLPTNEQEIWTKFGILAGIFGLLSIVAIAAGKAAETAGNGKFSVSPILGLTAMLYASVLALERLFKMDLPSNYGVQLGILVGIFMALGGLMIAVGYANKLAGGSLKATGSILAMCLFVGTAVAALMVLSIMPGEKMIKGGVALGIVLTGLAASLAGAGKIVDKNANKSILAMAVTVGTITASLAVLSMVPVEKLAKSSIALGVMLGMLAKDFKAIGTIVDKDAFLSIGAMAITVVAVAMSLYKLAEQPWEQLLAAGAAMSATLWAFSEAFATIGNPRNQANIAKIGEFLLLTLAVIPIGVALYQLAKHPWQQMLAAGAALSGTIIAFSACFALISAVKPNPIGIAAFLAGCVGVAGIGYTLYELAKQPWEQLLAAAGSISLVLVAMSGAMVLCAVAGSLGPGVLIGIAALDLFVLNLGLLLTALGALSKIDGFSDLIAGGSGILGQLGKALGDFVGNIIGGALSGVTSAFPQMGQDLADFANKAAPFFHQMSNLDQNAVNGVLNLAKMVLTITAADILNGIKSFFGGGSQSSLSKFGEELASFAPHFKKYADEISGINPIAVVSSANAAKILAEMVDKLPRSGGWADSILGTKGKLSEFGQELADFAPKLVEYANNVAGITPASVIGSASAAQIMVNLAKDIPNSGGLLGMIMGNNDMDKFGEQLEAFGRHLAAYVVNVAGITPMSVVSSAAATQIMADLADTIPNSGGLLGFFAGNNDLDDFGTKLEAFGAHLATYAFTVTAIPLASLSGVVTEVERLIALATTTSGVDMSGLVGLSYTLETVGDMGVESFVNAFTGSEAQVRGAINGMIGYATSSLSMGVTAISTAMTTITLAIGTSLSNGMTMNQGAVQSAAQTLLITMITSFQNTLQPSAFSVVVQNGLQGLVEGINAKRGITLSTSMNLCQAIIQQYRISLPPTTFNQIGQAMIQALINGENAKKALALSTAINISEAIIATFKQYLDTTIMFNLGVALVQALANGMNSARGTAEGAARNVGSAATSALSGSMSSSTWYSIGADAGQGLANGISSKISAIAQAAASAAAQAVSSARQALNSHSPSKEMISVGEDADEGMAIGLKNGGRWIWNAGYGVGKKVVDVFQKTVDEITDFVQSDAFDLTPTVRPVIDLSNLNDGAKDISSMFNRTFNLSSIRLQAMEVGNMINGRNAPYRYTDDDQNELEKDEQRPIYVNYEQNNYSPKPLNRAEIYRDTKSLFAATTNVVEVNTKK